jgi:hypothetical protein
MATYSTVQTNSSYGNINMSINIYRGDCTRTETSVSFKFGACFKPVSQWTSNSVAAWYGGVQRFANVTRGNNDSHKAQPGTTYHAYYSNRNTSGGWTSENLCFSYSNSNISATTTSVSVTIGVGWANWAGSEQGSLTFSLPIPQYYGNAGIGTTTVADNYNNSFTITATKGTGNTSNNATSLGGFKYGYSSTTRTTPYTNGQPISFTPPSTIPTGSLINIFAESTTSHANTYVTRLSTGSNSIRCYYAPAAPTNLRIEKSKTRLTIKEDWTLKWDASKPRGDFSPVKGYKVMLYKKSPTAPSYSAVAMKNSSGTVLTTSNVRDVTSSTSLTFNPDKTGLQPGDKVKIYVKPYTKMGESNTGTVLEAADYTVSGEFTVQNAAVMRVKPTASSIWKEGQVWVRTATKWVEADVVKIRSNNVWKESE